MIFIYEDTNKDVFDTTDTGMSYYNDFLKPSEVEYYKKNKNRIGKIEMMSPAQYYRECADKIFGTTVTSLIKSRGDDEVTAKYQQMMRDGVKFHMCVIDYADKGQEGLHRIYAAGEEFGWDTKFPVLCIYVYDQEEEDRYKKVQEMYRYLDYQYKKDIDDVYEIVAIKNDYEIPEYGDILTQLENEYYTQTKCECEIDVTIYEDRGNYMLKFVLTNYKGLDLTDWETSSKVYTRFLKDLFDVHEGFNPDYMF